MSHAPDNRRHVAALCDLVDTTLPMYEYGQVPGLKNSTGTVNPGSAPIIYGLIQVERIGVQPLTMDRRSRRSSWRASLRAAGKSTADNGRAALAHLLDLEDAQLVVDGHESTPLHVESSEDVEPDNGYYSALVRFTYTL